MASIDGRSIGFDFEHPKRSIGCWRSVEYCTVGSTVRTHTYARSCGAWQRHSCRLAGGRAAVPKGGRRACSGMGAHRPRSTDMMSRAKPCAENGRRSEVSAWSTPLSAHTSDLWSYGRERRSSGLMYSRVPTTK